MVVQEIQNILQIFLLVTLASLFGLPPSKAAFEAFHSLSHFSFPTYFPLFVHSFWLTVIPPHTYVVVFSNFGDRAGWVGPAPPPIGAGWGGVGLSGYLCGPGVVW